jgi:TRAP-type C4-dicarboxylate transport system substrate-binding protein
LVRASLAYKAEYRVSMASPPGTVWHQGSEQFARLVQERTQDRIRMKVYPGSSLVQGQQDRELVALRQGVIDVLTGTTLTWSGTVKDFSLFHLPFLMPTNKAVDAVLASDALNKDFYDIMRKSGLEPLASAEYGAFQILNSKRRVVSPEDMKGLKIRTVSTPMQQELMNAFGANPTTMSFADAQPALASGAVDGLTMTVEQVLALKLYTLGLKYLTKWNAHNEFVHIAIANPVWKSWSEEDQKIVRTAAKEAAAEMNDKVRRAQAVENAALKAVGVDVVDPTPAQAAVWQETAAKVSARWKATINPELASKVEQVVAQAAKS